MEVLRSSSKDVMAGSRTLDVDSVPVLVLSGNEPAGRALALALNSRGVAAEFSSPLDPAAWFEGRSVLLVDLDAIGPGALWLCRQLRTATGAAILATGARAGHGPSWFIQAAVDEFVAKPCRIGELADRIRAREQARRPGGGGGGGGGEHGPDEFLAGGTVIRRGNVEINLLRQTVSVNGAVVTLARKEFQILTLISAQRGGVCARGRLIEEIWGKPWPGADDALNVHVATLRNKLGYSGLIVTVRGHGYRLATESLASPPS